MRCYTVSRLMHYNAVPVIDPLDHLCCLIRVVSVQPVLSQACTDADRVLPLFTFAGAIAGVKHRGTPLFQNTKVTPHAHLGYSGSPSDDGFMHHRQKHTAGLRHSGKSLRSSLRSNPEYRVMPVAEDARGKAHIYPEREPTTMKLGCEARKAPVVSPHPTYMP